MNSLNNKADFSLYSNAFSFLRFPLNFQPYAGSADWVITGVPFDLATSGRSGARHGPGAIRQASVNLAWEKKRWPWNFALIDYLNVIDCGDLVFKCGDAQHMCDELQQHADKVLAAGSKMLTFGGDHFITLPLLRSHAHHFGKMALLHFDAHTDTYAEGGKFDHGTMFYHAVNENLIDPYHSVQLGIRTEYHPDDHFTVISADEINAISDQQLLNNITQIIGNLPVYLTFDIDCLDPAFAPGTGTPVCGGCSSARILTVLRQLDCLNIIGMDLVEVAPAYDQSNITALAAATIALDLLYLQGKKQRERL